MKLAFHGAARTVTGSKHLLTLNSGVQILLDCGMFQGMGGETEELNKHWGFQPDTLDFLVLSHAHIDHSGLIPKLVKDGFSAPIYCTPATYDLVALLLEDSAGIQEYETERLNRQRAESHLPPVEAMYDKEDVKRALALFQTVDYDTPVELGEQVTLRYTDAGHILGSASVHLRIREEGAERTLTFSGDVGQYNSLILRSPQKFEQSDYIILESTYGNSLHKDGPLSYDELLRFIKQTCVENKGKLVIPSFSVGRTQQLLYDINKMYLENDLRAVEVFLDSPLSIEATEVTVNHPECFNKNVHKIMTRDDNPFEFPQLKFIRSVDESKALNYKKEPCVIISASGMADAGRVKHHIANNISNPANTILMVGYCAPGTFGAHLLEHPKEVTIYGKQYVVKAGIDSIRSMSAHGDYDDLCQYLACQDPKAVDKLFLVHGEYEVQQDFRDRLIKKGFADVIIPGMHEEIGLG